MVSKANSNLPFYRLSLRSKGKERAWERFYHAIPIQISCHVMRSHAEPYMGALHLVLYSGHAVASFSLK